MISFQVKNLSNIIWKLIEIREIFVVIFIIFDLCGRVSATGRAVSAVNNKLLGKQGKVA